MHVVAEHRITDPEKFFEMSAEDVAGNAPEGARLKAFLPSTERNIAVCLWETDSLEKVQGYVDSATEGIAENMYFGVDGAEAYGLPEAAAASA